MTDLTPPPPLGHGARQAEEALDAARQLGLAAHAGFAENAPRVGARGGNGRPERPRDLRQPCAVRTAGRDRRFRFRRAVDRPVNAGFTGLP